MNEFEKLNSMIVDSGDIAFESDNISHQFNNSLPNEIFYSNEFIEYNSIEKLIINYEENIERQCMYPCTCKFVIENQKQIYPQLILIEINPSRTSINFMLPQSIQYLQLSRAYCPRLIDSKYSSKNSFQNSALFIKKSITTVFNSYTKIFQHSSILFTLCSILGVFLSKHGYIHLDFLLISTCISSIFVLIYEKYSLKLSTHKFESIKDNRQVKLVLYGLIIGIVFENILLK